jgi:cytochrome b involved in lipid metabolism
MPKTFTRREVASHNQPEDIWIVIDNEVFNVSTFQDEHPGGKMSKKEPVSIPPSRFQYFYTSIY